MFLHTYFPQSLKKKVSGYLVKIIEIDQHIESNGCVYDNFERSSVVLELISKL